MCYKKLAYEYIMEAKKLNLYIKKLKKQYNYTNNSENIDIYYRIKTLYNMYLDLKHVGEYLMGKYGGGSDG